MTAATKKKKLNKNVSSQESTCTESTISISSSTATEPKKNRMNGKKKTSTTGTTTKNNSNNNNQNKKNKDKKTSLSFEPLTLSQIRDKLHSLSTRVPQIPEKNGIDPNDKEAVKLWAGTMQAIIEEFNLLLCCVSPATYKWGTDRTGAADQNLGLLSSELSNAQDQISSSITPRLTNVLAPVVELVTHETTTVKEKNGVEKKTNTFKTEENDPAFVHLCRTILCRNAFMLRTVFLTNLSKVGRCIDDYLKAAKQDNSNRSFAY